MCSRGREKHAKGGIPGLVKGEDDDDDDEMR
jgi:hypothetical protein